MLDWGTPACRGGELSTLRASRQTSLSRLHIGHRAHSLTESSAPGFPGRPQDPLHPVKFGTPATWAGAASRGRPETLSGDFKSVFDGWFLLHRTFLLPSSCLLDRVEMLDSSLTDVNNVHSVERKKPDIEVFETLNCHNF